MFCPFRKESDEYSCFDCHLYDCGVEKCAIVNISEVASCVYDFISRIQNK